VLSRRGFSFGNSERTLRVLNVSSTGITSSSAVKAIGRCRRLVGLNASWNPRMWLDAYVTADFGWLRLRLRELDVGHTRLTPAVLSEILEFGQLVELSIRHNDGSCGSLGSSSRMPGGMRSTLKRMNMGSTGLTGRGLQWIFREFRELKEVNARGNRLITPADLMGLDFETLGDRLAKFSVTADDETLADLRRKLPLTRIC